MRKVVVESVTVAIVVAFASRFAEWSWRTLAPHTGDMAGNAVGMSIAGLTAGVLFFLFRYQHQQRVRLVQERERIVRHVHHHVRNSLQVILNKYPEDPLISKHVAHILKEMTYALPGRGRTIPEEPGERLD